jgi:hypothetical protein
METPGTFKSSNKKSLMKKSNFAQINRDFQDKIWLFFCFHVDYFDIYFARKKCDWFFRVLFQTLTSSQNPNFLETWISLRKSLRQVLNYCWTCQTWQFSKLIQVWFTVKFPQSIAGKNSKWFIQQSKKSYQMGYQIISSETTYPLILSFLSLNDQNPSIKTYHYQLEVW